MVEIRNRLGAVAPMVTMEFKDRPGELRAPRPAGRMVSLAARPVVEGQGGDIQHSNPAAVACNRSSGVWNDVACREGCAGVRHEWHCTWTVFRKGKHSLKPELPHTYKGTGNMEKQHWCVRDCFYNTLLTRGLLTSSGAVQRSTRHYKC